MSGVCVRASELSAFESVICFAWTADFVGGCAPVFLGMSFVCRFLCRGTEGVFVIEYLVCCTYIGLEVELTKG